MVHWQPVQLTGTQCEQRRLAAARFFHRVRAGRVSQGEIARATGVSRQSVSRWYAEWAVAGRTALQQRPRTGRPPRLETAQWDRLAAILTRGAVAAGFESERWTLRRIALVMTREQGVHYHFRSVGRVLRAHGWSPQRPATRAV